MRTFAVLLAAAGALALAGPAGAATRTVDVFSFFKPASVTIHRGDTVLWRNEDNDTHQVLAGEGRFVSPILRPRQTYSFTFNAAGIYDYRDELHPKLRGVVTVLGAVPALTLFASQVSVTYGDAVTLSGIVSDHRAAERVTIYYKPYLQAGFAERAIVLTSTGGAFTFVVQPRVVTTYEAVWRRAFAPPATIQVAPKLSLGRNGAWIVHASAGKSLAGRAVQLQRLDLATGRWLTLRKVLLNTRSTGRADVTLPKGLNHLRLTMSVNQAGAGYLGAISSVLTWRQR